MKLSVVVITRNAGVYVGCLDSLIHQSRKPDEILVVDANSTDGHRDSRNILEMVFVKLLMHPTAGL